MTCEVAGASCQRHRTTAYLLTTLLHHSCRWLMMVQEIYMQSRWSVAGIGWLMQAARLDYVALLASQDGMRVNAHVDKDISKRWHTSYTVQNIPGKCSWVMCMYKSCLRLETGPCQCSALFGCESFSRYSPVDFVHDGHRPEKIPSVKIGLVDYVTLRQVVTRPLHGQHWLDMFWILRTSPTRLYA